MALVTRAYNNVQKRITDIREETIIQRSLRRLLPRRTSLVIIHRLSTVDYADQILVIEDGNIAERGIHSSLLAAGDLYRRQFREPAPATPS